MTAAVITDEMVEAGAAAAWDADPDRANFRTWSQVGEDEIYLLRPGHPAIKASARAQVRAALVAARAVDDSTPIWNVPPGVRRVEKFCERCGARHLFDLTVTEDGEVRA